MFRTTTLATLAAVVFTLPAAPAAAADCPVPAGVPLAVRFSGIDTVRDRLTALVKNAAPEVLPFIPAGLAAFPQATAGRELKGLLKDRPVYAVLTSLPNPEQDQLELVYFVPVANYDEFRDGLLSADERKSLKRGDNGVDSAAGGFGTYFLKLPGYAAVSTSPSAAAKVARGSKGLLDALDEDTRTAFTAADVTIYADGRAVNRLYGEQIADAKKTLMGFIDKAAEAQAGINAATVTLAKDVYASAFRAVADAQSMTAGLDFRPDGLHLAVGLRAEPGTDTAKFMERTPYPFDELARLPAGKTTYSGVRNSAALVRWAMPMTFGAGADPVTPAGRAAEALAAAGPGVTVSAADLPARGVQLAHFDDPKKAAAALTDLFLSLPVGSNFSNLALKAAPEVTPAALSHRGLTLDRVRLKMDLSKSMGGVPDDARAGLVAAVKTLVDEEMTLWVGSDGRAQITVTAPSEGEARRLLDEALAGEKMLGGEAAYALARRNLPAGGEFFILFDAFQSAKVGVRYAQALLKAVPAVPVQIPEPTGRPGAVALAGAAAGVRGGRGEFQLWLPAAAVREARGLFAGPID